MSSTIKAIERQWPSRANAAAVERLGANLFGVWQQRGPETFSGHVVRKLRLTLASPQSAITANAAG